MTKECKRTNIDQSALQTRYKDNQKRTKHSKNNFISFQEAKDSKSFFPKRKICSIYSFVPQISTKGEVSSVSGGNQHERSTSQGRLRAG